MARMSRMNCLGAMLLIAFAISGCQSPGSKWSTAWKERTKPKPSFQGVDGPEEVTYWPYKSSKANPKMTEIPSQLKEKMARKSQQSKRDSQLAELMTEGDQLRRNAQLEDARLVYNKALMIAPENPEVHHRLAIVADKQHQYGTADEHYQAALRVRPRDVNLLSDMGYSYFLRGNTQQAENTLKNALAIDKSHKGAMANLGMIYAQQNRYPEALEMFRNGATEAEAQQFIAKLFPQGRSGGPGASPDQGFDHSGPAIASRSNKNLPDLSKMSQEQVLEEMARLRQEAKMGRERASQQAMAQQPRNFPDDDWSQSPQTAAADPRRGNGAMSLGPQGSDSNGFANNPPASDSDQRLARNLMPSTNDQSQVMNGPFRSGQGQYQNRHGQSMNVPTADQSMNSQPPAMADQPLAQAPKNPPTTTIYRGSRNQPRGSDSMVQPAWDQQNTNSAANTVQQVNASNNASQMATQLGMSAGPGSMFPIVTGNGRDNGLPSRASAANDNRFGSEYQQTPNYQNSQNWSGNASDQSQGVGQEPTGKEEMLPSIAPASPLGEWSSPTSGTLNWQNDSPKTSGWGNNTPSSGTAGNSMNSQGALPGWGQGSIRYTDNADSVQPNTPMNRYDGPWPNSNSLPQRQNLNIPAAGRSPETMEMMGINPMNGGGNAAPTSQNGFMDSQTAPAANSLPQYPYAPNR